MHWWIHVATPIICALIVNGIIFGLKWSQQERNKYLPPGYIIAVVWVFILGILGFLHYLVYAKHPFAAWSVISLITFCLLYPFITSGLRYNALSKIMNLATLILSFMVAIILPRIYIGYMLPIIIWASYVNIAQLL